MVSLYHYFLSFSQRKLFGKSSFITKSVYENVIKYSHSMRLEVFVMVKV